ncbi:MAG: tetratricopeptide repeat protein, partial [Candidatus Gastranaerophilales bacterium]|nr:tetratricopeptide repeat protein [Candidatus Gastranaerophilales bacterium]
MKIKKTAIIIAILLFAGSLKQNSFAEVTFDKSAQYYNEGVEYYSSNQFTKAIESFELALQTKPGDKNAKNNLAASYISRGVYYLNSEKNSELAANDFRNAIYCMKYDINSSEEDFLENLQIAQNDLEIALKNLNLPLTADQRYKNAKELRGQGLFKPAIVEFYETVENNKYKYDSYVAIGDLMTILNNPLKAAPAYDNALMINSADSSLHLKFAKILLDLDNSDAAIREFNVALAGNEDNEEIVKTLERIWREKISENPENAMAHMNLGVILQKKGDYDAALTSYKTAERIDPSNSNIRLNLGTFYQSQKQYESANSAYDSIIQVYPSNMLAHYYKATLLNETGHYGDAIVEFRKTLEIKPDYKPARLALYETIKNSVPKHQRLEILNQITQQNPNDAYALYNYAFELHSVGKAGEAVDYYKKAVSIDSGLTDAYLNLAMIYKDEKNFTEATAYAQKVISNQPDNKEAANLIEEINNGKIISKYKLAVDKYEKKDYQGAIELYKTIQNPTAEVFVGLGACYQAMEKYDEAINYYNSAIDMDETNLSAYNYLGSAYYTKKDYRNATLAYKNALNLDPSNKDVIEALDLINQTQA